MIKATDYQERRKPNILALAEAMGYEWVGTKFIASSTAASTATTVDAKPKLRNKIGRPKHEDGELVIGTHKSYRTPVGRRTPYSRYSVLQPEFHKILSTMPVGGHVSTGVHAVTGKSGTKVRNAAYMACYKWYKNGKRFSFRHLAGNDYIITRTA